MRNFRNIAGRYLVLGLLVLTLAATALAIERAWPWCPADWSGASRIDLGGSSGDVMLDGRPFRVGGLALLDYMPRIVTSPLDQVRAGRHPLTATASISASSRDALGEPVFTCLRATRGSEVWARRPTAYGTQTMADGYPPGAQPPAINEAWRRAVATDGPEWLDGDAIGLEFWASVNGRRYVFVLPPFGGAGRELTEATERNALKSHSDAAGGSPSRISAGETVAHSRGQGGCRGVGSRATGRAAA